MPPRYAYWTIIAGGLPTDFRAADQDELMPTFQRIKEKHPDAQMKWFARGKLWESQDAARAADRRGDDRRGPPGQRSGRPSGPPKETRTRDWRPGGEHRDSRQKFIDAKKQRNATLRKDRWQRKNTQDAKAPAAAPARPERPRGPSRERTANAAPKSTPPHGPERRGTTSSGPPERGRQPGRPFRSRENFRKGPRR